MHKFITFSNSKLYIKQLFLFCILPGERDKFSIRGPSSKLQMMLINDGWKLTNGKIKVYRNHENFFFSQNGSQSFLMGLMTVRRINFTNYKTKIHNLRVFQFLGQKNENRFSKLGSWKHELFWFHVKTQFGFAYWEISIDFFAIVDWIWL